MSVQSWRTKAPIRRFTIRSLGLACLLATSLTHAQGLNFPSQPIRWIVPFSPGGLTDIMARQMAPGMAKLLGTSVVVENMPGAGAIIGTTTAARMPPDGHTWVIAGSASFGINPAIRDDLQYDPIKDFDAICRFGGAPNVLVGHPSLGVNNVSELLQKMKEANLSFASAGYGTASYAFQQLFRSRTGASFQHVPYKGTAPAITDTVAGHVPLLFETVGPLSGYIKNGQLTAFGVTSSQRLSSLPDVPTFAEQGISGMELQGWIGLAVPAGTPDSVRRKIGEACKQVVTDAALRNTVEPQGFLISYAGPEEFEEFIKSEIPRWKSLLATSETGTETK